MPLDLRQIDPELEYPLNEVAGVLDLSYGTILNKRKKGEIKAKKIGKKYFVKGADILAYANGGNGD